MFKKLLALVCAPIMMVACLHGTVSDTISDDQTFSFRIPSFSVPDAGSGVQLPPITVSQTVPVNVSDALSKMSKLGTINLTVLDNSITYNGSYAPFQRLVVYLSTSEDRIMDYSFTPTDTGTVQIPVLWGGQRLYDALSTGSVDMIVNLTVNPNDAIFPSSGVITLNQHMLFDVSDNVSK